MIILTTYKQFLYKPHFFIKKIDFFKDNRNYFQIVWILKQDPEAGQNTIGYVSWKFKAFWKILIFEKIWIKKTPIGFFLYYLWRRVAKVEKQSVKREYPIAIGSALWIQEIDKGTKPIDTTQKKYNIRAISTK